MLDEIRKKIQRRRYEFSKHAVDQSMVRNISVKEVEEAIEADVTSSRTILMINTAPVA